MPYTTNTTYVQTTPAGTVTDVRIRRPRLTVPDFIGRVVAGVLLLLFNAAVLSWALAHVDALPSLGYVESAFAVLAANALFHRDSSFLHWTTPEEK